MFLLSSPECDNTSLSAILTDLYSQFGINGLPAKKKRKLCYKIAKMLATVVTSPFLVGCCCTAFCSRAIELNRAVKESREKKLPMQRHKQPRGELQKLELIEGVCS